MKWEPGSNYDKLSNWPEWQYFRDCSLSRDRLSEEKYREIHTKNLVPLILINSEYKSISDGILADIAPTILKIMNIEIPSEMTQNPLV